MADEVKEVKQEKPKGDKVLKAIKELPDNSIDFVFFDPFLRFTSQDGLKHFKSAEDRDKYIKRMQKSSIRQGDLSRFYQ